MGFFQALGQIGRIRPLGLIKVISVGLLVLLLPQLSFAAEPASSHYKILNYDFGSGGTEGSTSTHYSIFGISGQTADSLLSSSNFKVGSGLVFGIMANVPPAPTFTNPGTNYDRLKFVLDNGNNPSDGEFAIAISTDNFTTTNYIQADDTIGNSQVWQTYTNWGGATGEYVTGLSANTAYKIKVKARTGNYTESGFGPTATATTSDPTLSFGVSADSVTFNNLNSGNSYTDSTQSTILTTSTNAYNGYVVYGRTTQPLTFGSYTIANYASPNSAPTTWSGTGFGYTTNDSNLTGGTPDRFTNGGPKYAGFNSTIPGDPVADHAGPVTSAISNETFTISYRVTADAATTAGNYTSTILYIVVPSY